jgi:hypothetical protein
MRPADPPRVTRALWAGVLLAAAAPRVWLAWADRGIFWPDEVMQSIEPAHRAVFGYGIVAWEFREGARSWLFPGLLAVVVKLGALAGVRSGLGLLILCKLAVVALGVGGIHVAMRFAQRLASTRAALVAGALLAVYPPLLAFGSRCLGEVASAPVVTACALASLGDGRRARLTTGALAGVAVFLRFQNGIVLVVLLIALLAARKPRDAVEVALGAACVAVLGGLLDWATWGAPFHSVLAYLQANAVEGRSSKYGVYPLFHYVVTAWTSGGWPVLLVAAGLGLAWRRARAWCACVVVYVALHSLIPHKELRFLYPVLPLAITLAVVGWAPVAPRARRGPLVAGAVTAAAVLTWSWYDATLTYADLGSRQAADPAHASAWHHDEGANLALIAVARRDDACGVAFDGIERIYTGAYSLLHRDVPLLNGPTPVNLGRANYVVAREPQAVPTDYAAVDQFEGWALLRRDGPCAPSPPGAR